MLSVALLAGDEAATQLKAKAGAAHGAPLFRKVIAKRGVPSPEPTQCTKSGTVAKSPQCARANIDLGLLSPQ
jgi:hypothetical protein